MDNDMEIEPKTIDIARQQLNLEKWTNHERMRPNFEKHQATQINQEEE